jgi:Ni/Co efflux regulator RcnB
MAHRKEVAGKWRKRFLGAMARTANAGLSAQMAGVDRTTAFALRKRDPGFAADWVRARDWGRARAKAEGRPVFDCGRPRQPRRGGAPADARELIVRLSKREGAQIVRAGEGRWSPAVEADFFAWLTAGFGVNHAARQIGFSTNALYRRRLNDPDFAARWAKVREEGLGRNDELLIDAVPRTLDPEVMAAAADLPRPTIAEAIQIQKLYRSDGEGGAVRGRSAWPARPRSLAEVHESILSKLSAIARVRDAGRLAEGWVRDEEGNWIPPGWARKDAA